MNQAALVYKQPWLIWECSVLKSPVWCQGVQSNYLRHFYHVTHRVIYHQNLSETWNGMTDQAGTIWYTSTNMHSATEHMKVYKNKNNQSTMLTSKLTVKFYN